MDVASFPSVRCQLEERGYNEIGALTSVDRPQVDETRMYDNLHRLEGIDNTGSVEDAAYTYDANSNVTSESFTGVMANYGFSTGTSGYDNQDRFTRWIRSGTSTDYNLTRSAIGNISNVNLNVTNTARGYDNAHALTSIGAESQSFDTDGNATLLQSGVSVAWDEAGMVKSTTVPSGASAGAEGFNEYGYDAEGKRSWKKITRSGSVFEHKVFVYSGPNCVAEYNAGAAATSPVQEYVYADTIDSLVLIIRSDGQKLGTIRNRQWSLTALYDTTTGSVVERYAYTPFGTRTIHAPNATTLRPTSSYNNPYGYTNREHDDESGLMYFRARYYDSSTGEFLSRDPLGFVDGMSLYPAYFLLGAQDPTGTRTCYDDCIVDAYNSGNRQQLITACMLIGTSACFANVLFGVFGIGGYLICTTAVAVGCAILVDGGIRAYCADKCSRKIGRGRWTDLSEGGGRECYKA